jgi:hypothetical protein
MLAAQSTCFAPYFYRVHPDRKVDSVCTRCFEASSAADNFNFESLRGWESAHHCMHRPAPASVAAPVSLQA